MKKKGKVVKLKNAKPSEDEKDGATFDELLEELRQSNTAFASDLNRMKADMTASLGVSGGWSEADTKAFGHDRANLPIPLIGPIIDKLLGLYDANPYGIVVSPYAAKDAQNAQIVQALVRGIEGNSGARNAYRVALRSALACGYGYLHAYSETRQDGSAEIKLEAIQNPTSVIFDCLSIKEDGSDARFVAFADRISKGEAYEKYGVDGRVGTDGMTAILLGDERNENEVALATIYRMEEGGCVRYVCVGDEIVDRAEIGLNAVPIIRCVGVASWDGGRRKWCFSGVGHRAEGAQRLANFAATQMAERLALSPKANFIATDEAIAPYAEAWANSSRVNPPVLFYKGYDAATKREIPQPQQQRTSVELGDVQTALATASQLVETTTGVQNDIFGNKQLTATESITRSRAAESVVSGVFESLGGAVRQIGRVLAQMVELYWQDEGERAAIVEGKPMRGTFGAAASGYESSNFEIDIDAGPMLASQRREAVMQMTALIQVAPTLAPQIVPEIVKNIDGSGMQELAQRLGAPQGDPNAAAKMEALSQSVESLKTANDQLRQQLAQAQLALKSSESNQQNKLLELQARQARSVTDNAAALRLELVKQNGANDRAAEEIASRETIEAARIAKESERALNDALVKSTNNGGN